MTKRTTHPEASVPTLVEELERALIHRDIRRGFAALDRAFPKTGTLDFSEPSAISLLLCAAQWTDLGYRDLAFLDSLIVGLPELNRSQLPMLDFLKLRMAEAYRHLAGEQLEQSIDMLDIVLRAGQGLLDDYSIFLANFWKGRAHRKRGDYEHAHLHIATARAAAERAEAPKLVAVTKIHESWLAFQSGERQYAFQLLDEAETALRPTGHALSLGNIDRKSTV